MRTLFLSHTARPSGAELALYATLTAGDAEDTVVLFGERGPVQQRLEGAGVATEVLELPPAVATFSRHDVRPGRALCRVLPSAVGYLQRLTESVRRLDPDVLVSNSSKSHLLGFYLSVRLRRPLVSVVRDRVTTDFYSMTGVALLRTGLRTIPAGLIANSVSTGSTVPRPWRRGQLRAVVPSPVPSPGPISSHPGRRSEGTVLRVGMIGRLAPWKGQHVVIEAFARAFPRGRAELHFLGGPLFGEAEYEDSLRQLAETSGVAQRVVFHGHVDDVYQYMADWDIFVHASVIPEPFGQVVVQAMHMALPTVATAAGGPLETITDEVDGILYPPGDVDSLARVLQRLADDPALRSRLGSEARTSAQRYAPSVLAPAFRAAVAASAQPHQGASWRRPLPRS